MRQVIPRKKPARTVYLDEADSDNSYFAVRQNTPKLSIYKLHYVRGAYAWVSLTSSTALCFSSRKTFNEAMESAVNKTDFKVFEIGNEDELVTFFMRMTKNTMVIPLDAMGSPVDQSKNSGE